MDAAWVANLQATARRLSELAAGHADAALYILIQMAASEVVHYSARHAVLCAVVSELCAQQLGWSRADIESLNCAALTMNVGMTELQDVLAQQLSPLTPEQRRAVSEHAGKSAALLQAGGVQDPLWLDIVRRHHEADAQRDELPPSGPRMARLLRRVDIYTAKLSRRAGRDPRSPAIAARDACLNSVGLPDAVGATLMSVLGLYPPGCFVALANGDIGVVIERGSQAHNPQVVSLRRADGSEYEQPLRRDTQLQAFEVLRSLPVMRGKLQHDLAAILGAAPD
ncbi:MAG: phosphodiesterase [Burkholderiaceae bacterium]|nr:phosphodiesterase [Roseateles sp.]MBV8469474.1 phosphodiesterase [Burkholderiaceae bacterium]